MRIMKTHTDVSNPLERTVLQYAKQFDLHLHGNLADFVQKD